MQINEKFSGSVAKFFEDFNNKKSVQEHASKLDFKTFHQKHIKLVEALPYLHFGLFSVFSVATAAYYVGENILLMIGWMPLAVFITIAILGVWEYGKASALSNLIEGFYESKTHSGKTKINPALAIVALGMLGTSVFMSVTGAALSAKKMADKSEVIVIKSTAKLDSLNSYYLTEIKAAEKGIADIEALRSLPSREGSWLNETERGEIRSLRAKAERLETERAANITALQTDSGKAISSTVQKAETASYVMVAISSVIEMLICACVWFGWYFSYKTRTEKAAIAGTTDTHYVEHVLRMLHTNGASLQIPQISAENDTLNVEKPSVGFQYTKPKAPIVEREQTNPYSTLNVNVERRMETPTKRPHDRSPKTRDCAYCGEEFSYVHWKATYCCADCRSAASYQRKIDKSK